MMWIGSRSQGELDEVMQTAMQVSSSLTGSTKTSAEQMELHSGGAVRGLVGRWIVSYGGNGAQRRDL